MTFSTSCQDELHPESGSARPGILDVIHHILLLQHPSDHDAVISCKILLKT